MSPIATHFYLFGGEAAILIGGIALALFLFNVFYDPAGLIADFPRFERPIAAVYTVGYIAVGLACWGALAFGGYLLALHYGIV